MAVTVPVSGLLKVWRAADGVAVSEGDVVAVMDGMKMEVRFLVLRVGPLRRMAAEGAQQKAGAGVMGAPWTPYLFSSTLGR